MMPKCQSGTGQKPFEETFTGIEHNNLRFIRRVPHPFLSAAEF
jgi:hypothetical protein